MFDLVWNKEKPHELFANERFICGKVKHRSANRIVNRIAEIGWPLLTKCYLCAKARLNWHSPVLILDAAVAVAVAAAAAAVVDRNVYFDDIAQHVVLFERSSQRASQIKSTISQIFPIHTQNREFKRSKMTEKKPFIWIDSFLCPKCQPSTNRCNPIMIHPFIIITVHIYSSSLSAQKKNTIYLFFP